MEVSAAAKTQPIISKPSTTFEEEVPPAKPSEAGIQPAVAETKSKPEAPKPVNKIGDIEKGVARSFFDSVFRGVIRYFENLIDNQPLRVLYRLGSETARKTSELAFLNVLDKKKTLSWSDLKTGSMRALEHVPATAIIEPSFYEGSIPRILAGLGNMTVRFLGRIGLSKVNPSSGEVHGGKNLLDEFASRSLARVIPVNFDNPMAGIGMRIFEQLIINLNLHVLKPLSRLFPEFGNFINKSQNAKKAA